MKANEFWKNFRLGEELSISGAFVYNGMRRFHEMRKLDFEDEVFEFLYQVSVGLERLLKIAVVLLEHNDSIDQSALEESLITHAHLDLLARVRKLVQVNLSPPQIDLLALLGRFYKTLRYDRFNLSSVYESDKETRAICDLLQKYLKVEIKQDSLFGRSNEERYRKFMRRTILGISRTIFKVIEARSHALNLYTYELRHGSKAESVFLREIDISEEDILWKELLVFFMNTKGNSSYLRFLRDIDPLDFDPALTDEYLDCFKSDTLKASVMDELEHHYTELGDKVDERLELMRIIGSPNVAFDEPDDDFPAIETLPSASNPPDSH